VVPVDGDPHHLEGFITADSSCDPLGSETLYWTPTPTGQSANCNLELTNHTGGPIDVAAAVVSGAGFGLASTSPPLPTTLGPEDVLVVRLRGTAGADLVEGDLVVDGARDRRFHLLLDPQVPGASAVLRTDDGCNFFDDQDARVAGFCTAFVTNNGTVPVTLDGSDVADGGFFDEDLGEGPVPPGINAEFHIFALNAVGAIPPTVFVAQTSAGQLQVPLRSNFAPPSLVVVGNATCGGDHECNVAAGEDTVVVRVANDGEVAVAFLAIGESHEGSGFAQVVFGVTAPFFLDPGEARDLPLAVNHSLPGDFRNIVILSDDLGPLLQLAVNGS
jgi:hypothetical protein